MKKLWIFVFTTLVGMSLLAGCEDNSAQHDENNKLAIETGDFDVYFELIEPFSETYMVFGGEQMTHKNSVNSITLSTLSMEDAIPIYRKYPEFQKCTSPGAAKAKKATGEMNIIPADSYVLDALKEVLSKHTYSFQQGGDRVCVKLEGTKLEMTAAIVRQVNEDILNKLPRQARTNYFLVETVEIVEAQTALEGI
jgi:hypothetical protein